MDEIEYAKVYQELAAILNEFNLGWVAQQVADTVEIGKTIEERSLKRKTPLLKIVDYTSKEQLLMLIDAVEQATVHTSEMEDEIAYFLKVESESSPLNTKITFATSSAQSAQTIEFTSNLTAPRNKQAIALNRFGLGARPEDSIRADPQRWLVDQFARFDVRPASFASLVDAGTMVKRYREEKQANRRSLFARR